MSDPMSDWKWEKEHREEAPHSKHYQRITPEPIEVIEAWKLNFNLGQVIKYIGRAPYKNQTKQDLEKALWYLQRELLSYGSDV